MLPARVAGAERLLAVLDAELGELRQRLERLVERPPLVDVDLQRQVGDAAHGADALDVEAVAAAELQLQPPEARAAARSARRAMSSGSPSQTVHEVGGPARGRPSSRHTGRPSELPAEVVQRRVERRLRRPLAGLLLQPRADLLERERVVAEQSSACSSTNASADSARLVVAVDRRRLAVADDAVVAQLDLDDVVPVASTRARSRRSRPARSRTMRARQLHGAEPTAAR